MLEIRLPWPPVLRENILIQANASEVHNDIFGRAVVYGGAPYVGYPLVVAARIAGNIILIRANASEVHNDIFGRPPIGHVFRRIDGHQKTSDRMQRNRAQRSFLVQHRSCPFWTISSSRFHVLRFPTRLAKSLSRRAVCWNAVCRGRPCCGIIS